MSGVVSTIGFSLLQARVAVRCADPATVRWLREALTPWFTEVEPRAADVLVEVDPVERAPAAQGIVTDPVPCFALDQRVSALPSRRTGRTVVIDDHHFGVGYDVGAASVVVTPIRPGGRLRPATFRVVRELALAQARAVRPVDLHASGVAHGGRVSLLIGPKEAGKTTTLVHLAAAGGARLVANDRALVTRSPDGWEVRGVPTLVNVRAATLSRLPHLFRALPAVDHLLDLTVAEAAAVGGAQATSSVGCGVPADLALSPAQLAHAVGAERAQGGPLGSIAVVAVDEQVEGFRLDRLDPRAAAAQLGENRFGARTEPRPRTVFETLVGAPPPPPPTTHRDVLAALARDVATFELRVGPGFLDQPHLAIDLLDALSVPA